MVNSLTVMTCFVTLFATWQPLAKGTGVIDPELDTFPKLVRRNAERSPRAVAIREKDYGIWQSSTWQDSFERSRWIALGLASLGFARGDKGASERAGRGVRPGAPSVSRKRARGGPGRRGRGDRLRVGAPGGPEGRDAVAGHRDGDSRRGRAGGRRS